MPVIPFSSASRISRDAQAAADLREQDSVEQERRYREAADAKLKELRAQGVKKFDAQGGTPMINVPDPVLAGGARLNAPGIETPNPYQEAGTIDQSNYQPAQGDAMAGQFEKDRTKRASPDEQVMWQGGDSANGVGGPENAVVGLTPEEEEDILRSMNRSGRNDKSSDLRTRSALLNQTKTPDQIAEAIDLANKTGANRVEVEDDVETFRKMDTASRLEAMRKAAPKLHSWLDDPINLEVAHDDIENLGWWESATSMAYNTPGTLWAAAVGFTEKTFGIAQMGVDGADELGRSPSPAMAAIFGNPREADRIARDLNARGTGGTLPQDPNSPLAIASNAINAPRKSLREYKNAVMPQGRNNIESGYYSGFVSLAEQVPMIIASAVTKNPAFMTVGMTATTAGEAYSRATDEHPELSYAQRAGYALTQAGIEFLTEAGPNALFVEVLLKGSIKEQIVGFGKQQIVEQFGEQTATAFQDMSDWLTLHPKATWEDYLKERPSAALQTFVATLVAGGGQVALGKASDAVGQKLDAANQQKRAEDLANFVRAMGDNAKDSKLLKRLPDKYRESVAAITKDGGKENVLISPVGINELAQTIGVKPEQLAAALRLDPEKMAADMAAGDYISAPVGNYAALIQTAKKDIGVAGEQIYGALEQHIKFNDKELTGAEHKVFRDEFEKLNTLETDAETSADFADAADRVRNDARARIVGLGRYNTDTSSKQSMVPAELIINLARRENLDPEALWNQLNPRYNNVVGGGPATGELPQSSPRKAEPPSDFELKWAAEDLEPKQFEAWKAAREGLSNEQIADRMNEVEPDASIDPKQVATWLHSARGHGYDASKAATRVKAPETERIIQLRAKGWSNGDIARSVYPDVDTASAVNRVKALASKHKGKIEERKAALEGSPSLAQTGKSPLPMDDGGVTKRPPVQISPETEQELLSIYNDALPSVENRLRDFRKSGEHNKYVWQKYTKRDLEDIYGDPEDIPPDALRIVDADGAVIYYGDAHGYAGYASEKDAPTYDAFWEDVLYDNGWIIKSPTSLKELLRPEMDELAAVDAMLHLAKLEGWDATPVRDGANRYWTLSKEGPDGENIYVGVRVSNHSKQSSVGHVEHGKAQVDINLAPQTGKDNHNYAADDFYDMLRKLREADPSQSGSSKLLAQDVNATITFNRTRSLIRLFDGANLSSLAHEGAHWYLDLLFRMSKSENPHPFVQAQMARILEFAGKSQEWDGMFDAAGNFTEEGKKLQEQFAEAFEVYLMTGKAPSVGMRSVFNTFKQWLLGVYKAYRKGIDQSVRDVGPYTRARIDAYEKATGKKLTGQALFDFVVPQELRDVFNRMLATEDAINAAQTGMVRDSEAMAKAMLEKLDPEGKWKPERQQKFMDRMRERYAEAKERAEAALMARLMDEHTRARSTVAREEKRDIRQEVASELDEQPAQRVYQVFSGQGWRDTRADQANAQADAADVMATLAQMVSTEQRQAWQLERGAVDDTVYFFGTYSAGDLGDIENYDLSKAGSQSGSGERAMFLTTSSRRANTYADPGMGSANEYFTREEDPARWEKVRAFLGGASVSDAAVRGYISRSVDTPGVFKAYIRGPVRDVDWQEYTGSVTFDDEAMTRLIDEEMARPEGPSNLRITNIADGGNDHTAVNMVVLDPGNVMNAISSSRADDAGSSLAQMGYGSIPVKSREVLVLSDRVISPGQPDDLGFITSAERALANPPGRFRDAKALTVEQWRKWMREGGATKEAFTYQIEPALKQLADEGVTGDIPKAKFEEALARNRQSLKGVEKMSKSSRADPFMGASEVGHLGIEKDYGDYIAPGKAANYRQQVLALPGLDYRSHNWSTTGAVGHIRTTQRVAADGTKVLHVEELQSDLHQEGAKYGYKGERVDAHALFARASEDRARAMRRWIDWQEQNPGKFHFKAGERNPDGSVARQGGFWTDDPTGAEFMREADAAQQREYASANAAQESRNTPQPPRAPMENWEEPFVRHVLQEAAKDGIETVTFPTWSTLHSALQNEGTRKFYDERLPKTLNRIARSLGLKVEKLNMTEPLEFRVAERPDGFVVKRRNRKFNEWMRDEGFSGAVHKTQAAAAAELAKLTDTNVPAIRLTPAAKAELLRGVTMYQTRTAKDRIAQSQTHDPSGERELDALGFYSAVFEAAKSVRPDVWSMGWDHARNSIVKGGAKINGQRVAPRETEMAYLGLDEMFYGTKLKGAELAEAVLDHIQARRLLLVENFARFDPNAKAPTKAAMLDEIDDDTLAQMMGVNDLSMGDDYGRIVASELDGANEFHTGLFVHFNKQEASDDPVKRYDMALRRTYSLYRGLNIPGKRELIGTGVIGDLLGKAARIILNENRNLVMRKISAEMMRDYWEQLRTTEGDNLVRGPGDIRLPGEDVPLFESVIGLPEGVPGSDYQAPSSHVGGKAKGTLVTAHGEERIDDKGQRTLFTGQVQSDMAQQKRDDLEALKRAVKQSVEDMAREIQVNFGGTMEQARAAAEANRASALDELDIPLLSTSEWTNVGVRAMVYRAARDGFASVSFPTSETSEIIQGNDTAAGHYDTNVKGALEKIGKQLGGEVRRGGVEAGIDQELISAEMSVLLSNYGSIENALTFRRGQLKAWEKSSNTGVQAEKVKKELRKEIADLERMERDANGTQLASAYILDITPAMRAKIVSEGFQLFQTRTGKDRIAQPASIPAMRLNLAAVEEQYGPEAVAALPPQVRAYSTQATDADDFVQQAIAVRQTLNKAHPKSLWKFLSTQRRIGEGNDKISYRGIRDPEGEILQIIGEKKAGPGLIADEEDGKRSRSYTVEHAAQVAWEEGYFNGESPPTPQEFYDALRNDFDGQAKLYRRADMAAVAEIDNAEQWAAWFDQNEIDINEKDRAVLKAQIETKLSGTAENAIGPDEAAPFFGLPDGKALLEALKEGPQRDKMIRDETERRMIERHGDTFSDGTMINEAMAYARNEIQHRQFEIELEALADAAGQRAQGNLAKQTAIDNLLSKQVREVLNYNQWLTLSDRWAKKAIEAAGKGDMAKAMEFARYRLINSHMYTEGKKLAEKIEKTRKHLIDYDSKTKVARLFAAGRDYADQMAGLLSDYQLRPESKKGEQNRMARGEWLRKQLAAINPYAAFEDETKTSEEKRAAAQETIDRSTLLGHLEAGTAAKNYKSITVGELMAARDEADAIWKLATLKDKLLKGAERRRLSLAAGDWASAIREHQPKARKPEAVESNLPGERTKRGWDGIKKRHRTFQSMVREMDGGVLGVGFHLATKQMGEASAHKIAMLHDAGKEIARLNEVYSQAELERMRQDRVHIPEVGMSLTKQARLAIALWQGTEKRRKRVMDSFGWSPEQLQAVLNTLDKRDWDWTQSMWDYVATFYPEANRVHENVHASPITRDEPIPVATRFGVYRGGYMAIKYDRHRSSRVQQRQLESDGNAAGAGRVGTRTERGFTKAMVEGKVTLPLNLDAFSVIAQHIDEVTTSITMDEVLLDVGRLVTHPEVENAVIERYGRVWHQEMIDALKAAKFGLETPRDVLERILNHVRNGSTISKLGWNIGTALLQPVGVTNSIVLVGGPWMMRGYAHVFGSPSKLGKAIQWAAERSEMMRHRREQQSPEQVNLLASLEGKRGMAAITRSAYQLMAQTQFVSVDLPTWYAAYKRAKHEGESDADAVLMADQTVKDAQGGGEAYETAGIQRGSVGMRIWTNLMSYMLVTYNASAMRVGTTDFTKIGQVAKLSADMVLLWSVPVAATIALRQIIAGIVGGGGDDDDDEGPWNANNLMREQLAFLMSPFWGLSQLGGAVKEDPFQYRGPAGIDMVVQSYQATTRAAQGEWLELLRPANQMAGMVLHYPANQVDKTVRGAVALWEGEETNPAVLFFGPPPK